MEVLERTPEVRRVKIKTLSPDKNLAQMAEDIVDKCKYIHPSRVEEIEQLLIKLRKHMSENASKIASAAAAEERATTTEPPREKDKKKRLDRDRYVKLTLLYKWIRLYFTGNIIISRRGDSDATEGNGRENYEGEVERQERLRAIAEEQLPPSSMDQIDEYMDMLYQGPSVIYLDLIVKLECVIFQIILHVFFVVIIMFYISL